MSSHPKLSSRLSSLNMFGKFTSSSKPPPPIEKDPWYQNPSSKSAVSLAPSQALSMHTSSIASMSVETLQLPQTPLSTVMAARSQYDLPRTMSPVSARSRTTTLTSQTQGVETSSFRRGISKIQNFGKKSKLFLRSNSSRTTLSMDGMRSSEEVMSDEVDGDEGISRPWNVQHHLHVDEGLENLPSEWMSKLREQGLKDTEVLSIHSRRNRTTYLKNHPDVSVDIIRARSQSPYTPASTTASPNTLSPLTKSSLPTRSTSLRRPTRDASDANSVTTSGRSGGCNLSPDSASPPSSFGFSSSRVPSDSSASSRVPSLYADGDTNDDYSDPGTATASQFGAARSTATSVSMSRALPRIGGEDGDPPAHTPPSRAATLTFVITNPTPPSPPPAYENFEHGGVGGVQAQSFPRDEKCDPNASRSSVEDRRASSSSEQQVERRSQETLTPEVLLRGTQTNPVSSSDKPSQCTSPPTFRLHLTKPSRDGSASASPPESPAKRSFALPPRLSLHQDDLDSWSASLFSAISTPNSEPVTVSEAQSSFSSTSSSASAPASAPASKPAVDTAVPPASSKTTSPKSRKGSVPPLVIHPPPNDMPRVTIETEEDDSTETGSETIEHGAGTSTTPLFDEVLSLVAPKESTTPNGSPPLTSTYPYLPPVPSPQQTSPTNDQVQCGPSQSPHQSYEFLKEGYNPQRDSTVSSNAGSRESQMTISASSRWSRATTIRDVRDATIGVAHYRKTSVANAVTVPAPLSSRHSPQPSSSTIRSGETTSGDGSGNSSRPLSQVSTDSTFLPSAADFPLPPPSPRDYEISSVQPSPMSGNFSVISDDVRLPYTDADNASIKRMSSPASTRSSQSSEGSGSSSSSSQVNPLSVASASDEGPEEHDGGTVHVQLQYSEVNVLSPTGSTLSELDAAKWAADQKKLDPPRISITKRSYTSSTDDSEDAQDRSYKCGSDVPDGASAVVEWLADSPSPQFDPNDKPLRDSGTLYNLVGEPNPQSRRPTLQINGMSSLAVPGSPDSSRSIPRLSPTSSGPSPSSATPSPSPMQRYRGWVSEVVAPLEEFIDHTVDPRTVFEDLREIAEGESGSVFSATVIPQALTQKKSKEGPKQRAGKVAVKQVPLVPDGSPKLGDLRKELMLVSKVSHENILSMNALYVDLVDDSLWIEMELMERSLADILALACEGLVLEEKVIARFTSDIVNALAHLETHGIVHRDVRSDNLLVNSQGVLKLADFSNGLLVDPAYPIRTDTAGVIYWQAPEMHSGSYDVRKVDIWSAGATAWEMAESEPPFMSMDIQDPRQLPERWPALSHSDNYSRSFHEFLTLCSNPSASRPSAHDLLMTPFIRSSCARPLIVDVLNQCRSIEERMIRRTSCDSQGTILS